MTAFKGGLREQSVTEMFLLRRTRGRGGSFGTAELGAGRGRAQPSLLFRLVWFWMGCSSCPRTRPVETCAGSVRSELEDDRPPCKTQDEDLRGNKTSVHENTGKQTIVQGNEKKNQEIKKEVFDQPWQNYWLHVCQIWNFFLKIFCLLLWAWSLFLPSKHVWMSFTNPNSKSETLRCEMSLKVGASGVLFWRISVKKKHAKNYNACVKFYI